MRSQINVAVIGFGTVGSGVVTILMQNADVIARRVGVPVNLLRIVDVDITTDRGIVVPAGVLSTDLQATLEDPSIDIIVELIGGSDIAKHVMVSAIAQGKQVVTANKALLAIHGEDIFEAAARASVDVGFEASVGGGIPVLQSLTRGLSANRVSSVMGILNGTANYILTQMSTERQGFQEALNLAKACGYAEADPTFDIEGIDTAHKLAIMINLAFGTPVNIKDISTEGITGLTTLDIDYAKELGMVVKLLGIAKLYDEQVEARVHPTLVPQTSPLAQVHGVYNAVHLVGDAVGDIMLYGQGAGSLPTASAVVSDVIECARNVLIQASGTIPALSFQRNQRRPLRLRPMEELMSAYYLHFMVLDRPGVLSQIAGILGAQGISIASVLQRGRQEGQPVPVVITTHRALERAVQTALHEIHALSNFVSEPTTLIRIESQE
ncbi:MAG: homoserine dehydrogenase [Nitrospirales bacterium]|nr:homoserine dehydrogenase [Nitrospirales bacterium]